MTGFKGAFACSVALVALTIAQPASALIMVSVSDGSTTINGCSVNDGGTGIVSASCSDRNFPVVSVTASGSPLLSPPGLTSNSGFLSFARKLPVEGKSRRTMGSK